MRILSILEEKVTFNCRQFGFKKGSSTSDACFLLKETLYLYTKNRNKAYVAFIDLSKAFDNVDLFLLGQQLLNGGIPPDIVVIIMHYLRNQTARVCWNGAGGNYIYLDRGVRQGGILPPFLFKLYINGLLNEISDSNVGCKYGTLRLNILAYADDVVLLADSKDDLEMLYNKFSTGIQELKLSINQNKSKCMIVECPTKKSQTLEMKLGNDNLEVVSSYTYLGHLLDSQLKDTLDIKQRLRDFNGRFNSLFRNFKNVSIDTFLFLFDSFCLPDYGLGLWDLGSIFSNYDFKIFETSYSNALKRIVGAPMGSSSHITFDICGHFFIKTLCSFMSDKIYEAYFVLEK